MRRCRNLGRCFPLKVELGLLRNFFTCIGVKDRLRWDLIALFVPVYSGCLLKHTLELVAILEEPGSGALRLVVFEIALEVKPVRVDPLSRVKLTIFPLSIHLHARLLE